MGESGTGPDLSFEDAARVRGLSPIAGVDEAGRGPWAGPVVAAAVILDPANLPEGINDSKLLVPERRAELFAMISESAVAIGFAVGDVARIDRDNILQATMWAMEQAVARLAVRPAHVLVDGNRAPPLACPHETIVSGDGLSLSVAAASIVAKVVRDRMMEELALDYPHYGFERHKGYGTPQHRLALQRLGPTPHHRRSFRPVVELQPIAQDEAF